MSVPYLKRMAMGLVGMMVFVWPLLANEPRQEKMILSNFPERITAPGTVFKQALEKEPVRLFYHHKNDMLTTLFIRVSLYNPHTKKVSIKTVVALGGPDLDEVFAGHQSARRYLGDLNNPSLKTILPGETWVVSYHAIKPDMVSAGIIGVAGETVGLSLKMEIIDPFYEQLSALNEEEEKPYRILEAEQGCRYSTHTYNLGNAIETFRVGQTGDYGILYDAHFKLVNTTSTYKQVTVYFSPAGGIARGVMLWDDQLVETQLIHPQGKEVSIKSIIVEPGETKNLRLRTIPEGGSFYPVDMVFQSKDHGMIGAASRAQKK
jgi:hypothetical protein